MSYKYSRLDVDDRYDSDHESDQTNLRSKNSKLNGVAVDDADDEVFSAIHREPGRERVSTTGSYDLAKFRRDLRKKLKLSDSSDPRKRKVSLSEARRQFSTANSRQLDRHRASNGTGSTSSVGSVGVKDRHSDSSDSLDIPAKKKWTRHQWIIMAILCLFMFVSTVAYSLLSPFFPQQAAAKGLSSLVTGLIFGFYEFVIFLFSPFMGKLVSKVSPGKMMLVGGLVSSASSFTFGFLVLLPDGVPFAVSCFVVRLFEGLGSSALIVASYSLVALEYPGEISSVNSYLEAVTGLGFMAGPPIGALLFQLGGFRLSFIVVGFVFFACSLASFCVLPPSEPSKPQSMDYKRMLKIPGVLVVTLQVVAAGVAITYLDPTMSPFLESHFKLSIGSIGWIFFIWSFFYTVSSPAVGKLGDKGYVWSLMIAGNILTAVTYLFLGPSPMLSWMLPSGEEGGPLWLLITSLIILGLGCSGTFIPPFQACLELVMVDGFEDDMETYGLVSGIIASASSMGSFIGPILAGYVYDNVGFYWSTTVCSFIMTALTGILVGYVVMMRRWGLAYRYDWDAAASENDKEPQSPGDENNNADTETLV